jgi:hypothetical protein
LQAAKVLTGSRTKAFYFILVVALVSVESTRAFLSEDEVMLVADLTSIATAGAAFAMSMVMFRLYGFEGYGKLYAIVAVGLGLWLAAESTWGYYELVLEEEIPYPSWADVAWLAGYGPLSLALVLLNLHYTKSLVHSVRMFLVASLSILLLAYIMGIIVDATVTEDDMVFLVSIAYPVADMFLLVPAISTMIAIFERRQSPVTIVLLVFATLMFVAGDAAFSYFVTAEIAEDPGIWDIFFHTAYLSIVAAFLWDRKELLKQRHDERMLKP